MKNFFYGLLSLVICAGIGISTFCGGYATSNSKNSSEYNELNETYETLQEDYNSLNGSYNSLQSDYNTLNDSYNLLQDEYNDLSENYQNLQEEYENLSETGGDVSTLTLEEQVLSTYDFSDGYMSSDCGELVYYCSPTENGEQGLVLCNTETSEFYKITDQGFGYDLFFYDLNNGNSLSMFVMNFTELDKGIFYYLSYDNTISYTNTFSTSLTFDYWTYDVCEDSIYFVFRIGGNLNLLSFSSDFTCYNDQREFGFNFTGNTELSYFFMNHQFYYSFSSDMTAESGLWTFNINSESPTRLITDGYIWYHVVDVYEYIFFTSSQTEGLYIYNTDTQELECLVETGFSYYLVDLGNMTYMNNSYCALFANSDGTRYYYDFEDSFICEEI